LYSFTVKREKLNQPNYDTLVITNNWNSKASYSFYQTNYEFTSEAFLSFSPASGTIEKGKLQEIKIGFVVSRPTKLETIFILDLRGMFSFGNFSNMLCSEPRQGR
jgi:hypothetical protein